MAQEVGSRPRAEGNQAAALVPISLGAARSHRLGDKLLTVRTHGAWREGGVSIEERC